MILKVCKRLGSLTNTSPWIYRILFLLVFPAGIFLYLLLHIILNIYDSTNKEVNNEK